MEKKCAFRKQIHSTLGYPIDIKWGNKRISKQSREKLNFIQGSFLSVSPYLTTYVSINIYHKMAPYMYKRKQLLLIKVWSFLPNKPKQQDKLQQSNPTLLDISLSQWKSDRYFCFLLPFEYIYEINIWIMKHFTSIMILTLISLPFSGSRQKVVKISTNLTYLSFNKLTHSRSKWKFFCSFTTFLQALQAGLFF